MDLRSPKFGTGRPSNPTPPPFYNPKNLSRPFSGQSGRSVSPSRVRLSTPDVFPDSEHDGDRTDLSIGLTARYMQLRDEVTRDKRRLRELREEYAKKKEVLHNLFEASKVEDASRSRLGELSSALSHLLTVASDQKPDSPQRKLVVIKKELRAASHWNSRIASLLVFLESQQQPFTKQALALRPRSRSPVRTHWSP